MKSLMIATFALLLFGAGCATSTVTPPPPPTTTTPPTALAPNPCTMEPTENEAGQRVYPIASKYDLLPHLGQIFTALDCQDPSRAKQVSGFNADGNYTAGILIKWKEGGASGQIREALRKLGFTEPDKQTMRADHNFSIDDLRALRDILNDPEAVQALDREDCVSCG